MVYHKDNKRPNIRPSVLRQIVPIYPNYVYNINRVDQTYNQIMSMGYFKSANVIFNEQADSVAKDNYVTFVGEGKEPADSVHQTREGYLQCDIQCIPALKQGYKIELEGSRRRVSTDCGRRWGIRTAIFSGERSLSTFRSR